MVSELSSVRPLSLWDAQAVVDDDLVVVLVALRHPATASVIICDKADNSQWNVRWVYIKDPARRGSGWHDLWAKPVAYLGFQLGRLE